MQCIVRGLCSLQLRFKRQNIAFDKQHTHFTFERLSYRRSKHSVSNKLALVVFVSRTSDRNDDSLVQID